MQVITSKENSVIKQIKKLKDKKHRDIEKKYIVEGIKLIKEAIEEKQDIETIVVCEDCLKDGSIEPKVLYEIAKYNCIYVKQNIFGMVTDVSNPQGILAVIKKDDKDEHISWEEDIIVLLDGVQDPGNLGTILRTVDSVRTKTDCSIK